MEDTFSADRLSVLERVAAGAPLPQLLEEVVRFVERQSPGIVCSIVLLDSKERCVRLGAAPNLPPEYVRVLDGMPIGPYAGSCGAAAYRGERVVVTDMAIHPNWEKYRHLSLPFGLRAGWSNPIFSPQKEVLGTFDMYYREPRAPNAAELHWVDVATQLVSMIIVRDRAEQAERHRDALCAFVYGHAEDALFYLSHEGPGAYRFLSVNPAFLKATGLQESAVEGKLLGEVVPPGALPLVLEKYEQAIAQREKVSWQEMTAYSAGLKYGNVTICPIFSPDGECTHLIGSVHDITAIKEETERRRSVESQLHHSQRMQALGTLVGGIAHDFNNILNALSINIETALAEAPAKSPLRRYLAEIDKGLGRAAALVRQILTFSRRAPPQRVLIFLRPVIEEALDLIGTTLPANVKIVTRFDKDTPPIPADATQIHQVVMNLCLNAVDALSARGGKIEIRVDSWEQKGEFTTTPIELPAGRYVRLSVSDNGCGMDAATAKRAFDPFFTTKQPDKGTGLGLSVVDGIVRGHSGTLEVKSEPGRGSTFTTYFPVTVLEPAEEATKKPPQTQVHDARVLYVDDEEALTYILPRALGRLGYRVTAHSDSLAALRDFRARPDEFDLVLTDIRMPGLSGPELVKEVRRVRPDVPVVMLSGYIRPEDREVALKLHVNRLLYKPSSIEDLSQTLSQEIGALAPKRVVITSGDK